MRPLQLLVLLALGCVTVLGAADHDVEAVRGRLVAAIAAIAAIAAVRASPQVPGSLTAQECQRIAEVLPWRRTLLPTGRRFGPGFLPMSAAWPGPADAPALRELLADPAAPVRAYAAEALATFHRPEDAARLVLMLGDRQPAQDESSSVGYATQGLAIAGGPAQRACVWMPSLVANHAAKGLHILLGHQCPDLVDPSGSGDGFGPSRTWSAATSVDPAQWPALLAGDPLDQVWYWQWVTDSAIEGDGAAAVAANGDLPGVALLPWQQRSDLDAATYQRWEQAWLPAFAARQLAWPAERRAMVRLLVKRPDRGPPLFLAPLDLGLPKVRVLELLAGEHLWPGTAGEAAWVVERLADAWRECFTAADAPRLRARFADPALGWTARAALLRALADLLPPVGADPDDATTATGFLRRVLGDGHDAILHPVAARELIRLDLEGQWPLLLAEFFREDDHVQVEILTALAAAPAGGTASARLAELLSDQRLRAIWLAEGDGMTKGPGPLVHLRRVALQAVTARCGDLLLPAELAALGDPARGAGVVDALLARLQARGR